MRLEVAPAEVRVTPGQPTIVMAQVFNTDDVIAAYRVRVFGVDPAWVRLDEDRLSLFPGSSGTVTVLVDVPASYPAGELRLGIEVTSVVDPGRRQLGESTLVVPPIREASLSVDPGAQTSGKRATFHLTVVNQGNTPFELTFDSLDPEAVVKTKFNPPMLSLQPGEQVVVPARVSGRRPIVGGPAPRLLTFSAKGADRQLESMVSLIQKPLLSRGIMSLVGLLIAITLFATVLTSTLGRVVDVSAIDSALLERAVSGPEDRGIPTNPGTASGTVTLLSSGSGVSGVTVEIFDSGDPASPIASAATAANGAYKITGLAGGSYKIRFRGAGFVELWVGGAIDFQDAKEITIAAGQTVAKLDMALGGVPGSIAGKVLGEDPADATVTLLLPAAAIGSAADAQVATVAVGADGTFLLDKVPAPALYDLLVKKDGFATERRAVNLNGAEVKTNVEITLRKGDGLISGVVLADNEPVGDVAVIASNTTAQSSTVTLTTGNVGSYNLRNLPTPGIYTLTFTKDGYAIQSETISLEQGQQLTGLTSRLAAGTGSISGTVRRVGSGPIGGVNVTVNVDGKPVATQTLSIGDVGTYLLGGLPLPGTYTVTFSGDGLATQVRSVDLDPSQNANVVGLDTTMTASTAQVTGTVTDETGPVDSVNVELSGGGTTLKTTSATSPLGSYVVRDIPPGTYTLTFSRDGSVPRSVLLEVRAGEARTVNVLLQPRAQITGTVYRSTGSTTKVPLAGAQVRLYRVGDFPATATAIVLSGADGKYTLPNLGAPETYIIEFAFPAGSVAGSSQQLSLTAGQQRAGLDATLTLG